MNPRHPKTLLIFSQVFVPDPASVGQHMADVAIEMARRGYPVRVYTSARGYENPSARYPAREQFRGVDIRRLPFSSFGKRSIFMRLVGTAAFMAQILFIGLLTRNVAGIFFSTSPPLVGLVASLIARLRGLPSAYWAMDLNPDQLIALGKVLPTDPAARVMEGVNRYILRSTSLVIALDRYMADRLEARMPLRHKMVIIPPWPHEDHLAGDEVMDGDGTRAPAVNPFRARHAPGAAVVVMYSGNHSPSNPLQTLLDAAARFKDRSDVRFLFVGGGTGKKAVEEFIATHRLGNAASLPYQPMSELKHSLSAADVHVVSLGDGMAGIIHPCKVYGAMAVGRPVLYLGPAPSHVSDLLESHRIGWHVRHGDVESAARTLNVIFETPAGERTAMGTRARSALAHSLSQGALCGRLCDEVERVLRRGAAWKAQGAGKSIKP